MLRLPPFTYVPARTADEAVELLARHGADALPVSGGTDLYANMKQRLFTPKVLVGLRPITNLSFIRYNDVTGLTIGALATITSIAQSEVVRRHYAALAAAAASISTPQLRNMGTIGGNICVDTRCNYYNQNLDWRKALGLHEEGWRHLPRRDQQPEMPSDQLIGHRAGAASVWRPHPPSRTSRRTRDPDWGFLPQ